jgi:hypothetical protein
MVGGVGITPYHAGSPPSAVQRGTIAILDFPSIRLSLKALQTYGVI